MNEIKQKYWKFKHWILKKINWTTWIIPIPMFALQLFELIPKVRHNAFNLLSNSFPQIRLSTQKGKCFEINFHDLAKFSRKSQSVMTWKFRSRTVTTRIGCSHIEPVGVITINAKPYPRLSNFHWNLMIYSEYVLQKLIEFIMQISDVHSESLQHFLSSSLSTLRCAFSLSP